MFSNPSGISLIPSTVSSAVASTHLPLSLSLHNMFNVQVHYDPMDDDCGDQSTSEDIGVVYINL